MPIIEIDTYKIENYRRELQKSYKSLKKIRDDLVTIINKIDTDVEYQDNIKKILNNEINKIEDTIQRIYRLNKKLDNYIEDFIKLEKDNKKDVDYKTLDTRYDEFVKGRLSNISESKLINSIENFIESDTAKQIAVPVINALDFVVGDTLVENKVLGDLRKFYDDENRNIELFDYDPLQNKSNTIKLEYKDDNKDITTNILSINNIGSLTSIDISVMDKNIKTDTDEVKNTFGNFKKGLDIDIDKDKLSLEKADKFTLYTSESENINYTLGEFGYEGGAKLDDNNAYIKSNINKSIASATIKDKYDNEIEGKIEAPIPLPSLKLISEIVDIGTFGFVDGELNMPLFESEGIVGNKGLALEDGKLTGTLSTDIAQVSIKLNKNNKM